VSELDRLSRSLADFAWLLKTAGKQGWGVVAIDLDIDTTTPTGELVANIMAAVSRWERQMIGVRSRKGWPSPRRRASA
jgi:DNA invertase Pin-like site-specific DNA recombinase